MYEVDYKMSDAIERIGLTVQWSIQNVIAKRKIMCGAKPCNVIGRSFGVLLWEMYSFGYMPYPGRSNLEVIDIVTAGGRLEVPRACPTTISDMMVSCWTRDADQRPSFADIVQRLQVDLKSKSSYYQPQSFHSCCIYNTNTRMSFCQGGNICVWVVCLSVDLLSVSRITQ